MKEIRWHGRGGQGSFTIARLLGQAASVYGGKYSQAFPSFGPERRGAPVLGFTRIDEFKITDRSEVTECDYVVVLDETLWGNSVTQGLKENTIIIINTDAPQKYSELNNNIVTLDATSLALEVLGKPITNTAMLGALIAVSEVTSIDNCKEAIKDTLKASVCQKNIELIQKAYELVKSEWRG